jgi:hypothetical protein
MAVKIDIHYDEGATCQEILQEITFELVKAIINTIIGEWEHGNPRSVDELLEDILEDLNIVVFRSVHEYFRDHPELGPKKKSKWS